MGDEWMHLNFASAYAQKQDSSVWYEREVNMPALLSLLPQKKSTILDFGCGPGDYTTELIQSGNIVIGTDISAAMIEIANTRHKSVTFVTWDGTSPYPRTEKFDCVFSKLALMFVPDLEAVARRFREILVPEGTIIFSVPHPFRTAKKNGGEYFIVRYYDEEVGDSGLKTQMVHRSLEDYIRPFIKSGFVVDSIIEPRISDALAAQHAVSDEYMHSPRRLIVRLAAR